MLNGVVVLGGEFQDEPALRVAFGFGREADLGRGVLDQGQRHALAQGAGADDDLAALCRGERDLPHVARQGLDLVGRAADRGIARQPGDPRGEGGAFGNFRAAPVAQIDHGPSGIGRRFDPELHIGRRAAPGQRPRREGVGDPQQRKITREKGAGDEHDEEGEARAVGVQPRPGGARAPSSGAGEPTGHARAVGRPQRIVAAHRRIAQGFVRTPGNRAIGLDPALGLAPARRGEAGQGEAQPDPGADQGGDQGQRAHRIAGALEHAEERQRQIEPERQKRPGEHGRGPLPEEGEPGQAHRRAADRVRARHHR